MKTIQTPDELVPSWEIHAAKLGTAFLDEVNTKKDHSFVELDKCFAQSLSWKELNSLGLEHLDPFLAEHKVISPLLLRERGEEEGEGPFRETKHTDDTDDDEDYVDDSSGQEANSRGERMSASQDITVVSPYPVCSSRSIRTTEPREFDVLCKRGGSANKHPGNVKYLEVRDQLQERYLHSHKNDKKGISQELVDAVHRWNGRFLMCDTKLGGWIEIDDGKARTKAAQALSEVSTKESRRVKRDKYRRGPATKRRRRGKQLGN